MAVSINKSCRTCMKNNVTLVDMFQMTEMNNCNLRIADLLTECTMTKVSRDDGLPQNLCEVCVKELQVTYTFRNQALKAEEEFRRLLSLKVVVKDEQLEIDWKYENGESYFEGISDFDAEFPKSEKDEIEEVADSTKIELGVTDNEKCTLNCVICNKSFNKQMSLDKHMKKHDNENSQKCSICSQSFDSERLLLEHLVTHTDIQVKTENESEVQLFPCPKCDLIFTKNRSLAMHGKKHKNIVSRPELFKCHHCEKEFKLKQLLKRHMKLHEDRPYQCSKCPKKYSRRDQLVDHLNKHEGVKPKSCPYCNKAFFQLCTLKDHVRIHTGETPFLCSECGRGFNNNSNLRQHMRRHMGLKPYACQLCPKTFVTKGQMKCHMSTHTGAHPYECEQCGATFTKPNSLKKHQLIHLGLKPFACDNCSMRFTTRDHLKRHYRVHTGEKPYKCEYCERAFRQSNDLVKHVRTHLGENTYSCTVCGMRFRLQSELRKHYPIHYVNSDEPPLIPVSKDQSAPLLILKQPPEKPVKIPALQTDAADNLEGRITITFNSNVIDKNGLAGDITINIQNDKS